MPLPTAVSCGWHPQYQYRHASNRWFRTLVGLSRRSPRVEACGTWWISQTNFMLPQETHHHLSTRTHTLWNKDAQRKEGTTRTRGSMARVSALGLVLVVYCSMLQQMGIEVKARATEEDRVNTTTCMPGTSDQKIFIDDERPFSSPPKFLVTHGADNNKSSVYTLETWCCWRPKYSLLACLRAKYHVGELFI